jgi:hypothetical protein
MKLDVNQLQDIIVIINFIYEGGANWREQKEIAGHHPGGEGRQNANA